MFDSIICAYRWFFLQFSSVLGFGWSIVFLSIACSFLMMPLLNLVSYIVKNEIEYQKVLTPQLKAITALYSNDIDRHIHIRSLYKRYNYSPICAVKKGLPLFVQIPFLLLTYFMLNGTAQLNGIAFLFLNDLGCTDHLAPKGVNVLPFIMTLINLLTVVATDNFTLRDRIQSICIAFLFLIVLYSAPSALLLYWTLNNFITFVRTLFSNKANGLKLLWNRIIWLWYLPFHMKSILTPSICSCVSLVMFILAVYMRLMVYMKVYFFNYMASYWSMNVIIAIVIVIDYLLIKNDVSKNYKRVDFAFSIFACSIAVLNIIGVASVFITFDVMMFITQHIDCVLVFDILFYSFIVLILFRKRIELKTIFLSIIKALCKHWFFMLIPIIFAIHYGYASNDFKLPFIAVFLLSVYMLIPHICLYGLMYCIYGKYFSLDGLLRFSAGVVAGVFLIPMFSHESGKFLGYGNNLLLRLVLMGLFALVFYKFGKKKSFKLFVLLMAGIVLTNVGISQYKNTNKTNKQVDVSINSEALTAFSKLSPRKTNSIYFLVYDGYMHDTILRGMNINKASIVPSLINKGFVRYDAYSVGSDTVASMGATFSIGNVVQGSNRSILAGNNPFCDFLRRGDFTTSYILCGYEMPYRGEKAPGDFYFPSPQAITKPEKVLYPCIFRGILSQTANTFNAYTIDDWIKMKHMKIKNLKSSGEFIYAHTPYPGHVPPNPAYWKSYEVEKAKYESNLVKADNEIFRDVDKILEKRDDSIIIVASDHGSFLSQPSEVGKYDAFTMLDRCGVQLLVRWPKDYKPCLKIDCLQNLFLEIMIYMSCDTSLAKYKSEGESLRIQYPLRAPAGAIKNSIIQSGIDSGKNIFDAAKKRADEMVGIGK